jgi:glutathione S-transferase
MLELYFWPMACSLASRIALMESGIEARYRAAHLWDKRILEDGGDFLAVSAKGTVPVLVLENGEALTENAAVLQYIADLRPETGLAPPAGTIDRYRLQEWLSFVGTEIHKAFLFPTFWYESDAAKASARERVVRHLSVAEAHLANRRHLVGERFTVADAYLAWALVLVNYCGVALADWPALAEYLERMRARPQVKAAFDIENALRKAYPPPVRGGTGRPAAVASAPAAG